MAHRILILDDDEDFNNLLTDIFSQSSYDVTSIRVPEEALKAFESESFDLVVTDQKMPGMSGEEFIRAIKKVDSGVPVIMVSGYLDNDTIRDLIREGVGGVFLKPLNVFSLLKRTAALLEEARRTPRRSGVRKVEAGGNADYRHSLPFLFESFPAKASRSLEFANKLYSLRNFRTNLVLIGHHGAHFRGVCKDLEGFDEAGTDRFVFLDPDSLNEDFLTSALDAAVTDGIKRVTLTVLETENLTSEARALVFSVARKESSYANYPFSIRITFCLTDDIDSLYETGKIDDELYMLLGTTEVRIPALTECVEDLPVLAQRIANDVALEADRQPMPRLDPDLREWIANQPWQGDYCQLYSAIRKAVLHSHEESLGVADVEGEIAGQSGMACSPEAIRSTLENYRNEYVCAVITLCRNDLAHAASILNVPEAFLEAYAKSSPALQS